jgi:hypothetical protein
MWQVLRFETKTAAYLALGKKSNALLAVVVTVTLKGATVPFEIVTFAGT